ncbi:MAG: hypothetical protein QM723_33655 [Myxococcaceae bacterium]
MAAFDAAAAPFEFEGIEEETPTHFVSLQTGINFGLIEVGFQSDHFVGSISTNVGWAVTSNGQQLAGDIRAGYAWALSPPGDTMWFFDLTVDLLPGRIANGLVGPFGDPNQGLFFAFGASVAFRYVHRSGLVLGFRLPLVGLSFGDWVNHQHDSFDFGTSMSGWYLGLGLSSSIFTLGLRF